MTTFVPPPFYGKEDEMRKALTNNPVRLKETILAYFETVSAVIYTARTSTIDGVALSEWFDIQHKLLMMLNIAIERESKV